MPIRSAWLLATVALVAGCGEHPEASVVTTTSISNDGGHQVTVVGVVISFDPGVSFVSKTISTVGSGGQTSSGSTTLNGHSFGVSQDRFHIGSSDYGPVSDGDRVRVAPDGVYVNEQPRGELPPALAP